MEDILEELQKENVHVKFEEVSEDEFWEESKSCFAFLEFSRFLDCKPMHKC